MANKSNERYNNALASLPEDTRIKIQNAVNEINGKVSEAGSAGSNVGTEAKTKFDKGLGDTKKSGINFLNGFKSMLVGSNPQRSIRCSWKSSK